MNPLYSVRFRLFALCISLLVVLGGANLLLGNINRQHEAQVLQQQEQYRRVSVIYAVQQAMGTYRFWLGQVNASGLVQNDASEQHAGASLEQAHAALERQLNELALFNPVAVTKIREALVQLPKRLREGVLALLHHDPTAEEHINQSGILLTSIDNALGGAAQREQALAESVQEIARERAARGMKLSVAIIASSAAFGLLLTFLVIRSIIKPMQTTVKALRLVNAGETSVDLPPVSQDEFGDMAVALRQFRDQAERLRRLAYKDPLTGLGNRAQLEETLREAMDPRMESGQRTALFFIDLDNFRAVNDSLGHVAGDHYLCEAVVRLQRFAPHDGLLCRYGGDKFALLLTEMPSWDAETLQAHLRAVAGNILRGMSEPFQLRSDLLPMSVSIGLALYPGDAEAGEQLISSAEAAMYLAKRQGRNNVQFASPELTSDARQQLATVTDIRRGLEHGEFEPFYQPVLDVATGRVTGAEALLRWRHPSRGLVNAGEFVPAAEAAGLIQALGEQCMIKACEQAARWRESDIRVSVNLSARQIEDRTALTLLERLHANGSDLGVSGLDFEITETAILQHLDQVQETLKHIQTLGHRLSVDDFGTGYSSLVYIQRFPINRIKIDRSFVARVESSREAHAIVAATIALGRSLDLEVVAEGVETLGQMRYLKNLGCTLQQGYLFTPALPAADFDVWCRTKAKEYEAAA